MIVYFLVLSVLLQVLTISVSIALGLSMIKYLLTKKDT